jgi:hypothetical protein
MRHELRIAVVVHNAVYELPSLIAQHLIMLVKLARYGEKSKLLVEEVQQLLQ